jgi:hypothetical protein
VYRGAYTIPPDTVVNAVAADGQAVSAPIVALSILEKKYVDTYIQASVDGVIIFFKFFDFQPIVCFITPS